MEIFFKEDEVAFLCGLEGTIALSKTLGRFFYLETDDEEFILFTDPDDLVVSSAFGIGEKVRRGLKCTIFQLRELAAPLIVLPKGHPASPRLKSVVSIGSLTQLSCKIHPGTHPEQNVLCVADEFHDLIISGIGGGADIGMFAGDTLIEKLW